MAGEVNDLVRAPGEGDGLAAVEEALAWARDVRGKPALVIFNTVKGKGVSFMEDDNNWHYRAPTADEVVAARRELGLA